MTDETKISQNKQKKMDLVQNLTKKFAESKGFFLADFTGLKHKDLEALRKDLKKVKAEFVIAKNTLIKKALAQKHKDKTADFESSLTKQTAAFFTYEDEIAAIKILAGFMKLNQLPKIKLGIFSDKTADEKDFMKISALPSKENLIVQFISRIQSPLYSLAYSLNFTTTKLVYALNQVKAKKAA